MSWVVLAKEVLGVVWRLISSRFAKKPADPEDLRRGLEIERKSDETDAKRNADGRSSRERLRSRGDLRD